MGSAAETRRRLLEQGRVAFAAKGHDGVSVQKNILEPTGISTGSFYHQFGDKTDLLVALLEQSNEELARLTRVTPSDRPGDDPVARTKARYGRWFDLIETYEDLFRIELSARTVDDDRVRVLLAQLQQLWVDTVNANVAAVNPEAEPLIDRGAASELIVALTRGIILRYLDTPADARAAMRNSLSEPLARFTIGGLVGLVDQSDA